MAYKSNDIATFFAGGFDEQFRQARTNGALKVDLSPSQINSASWSFSFNFVEYGGYKHWEDGTFIYNGSSFTLHGDTQFIVNFDADGNVFNRRMEKVKFLLGGTKDGKTNRDDYDYVTNNDFSSALSKFLHGEYHDPFNIGRGFDIDFGSTAVWDKSLGSSGETWDETHFNSLKSTAASWRSYNFVVATSGEAYWATLGEKISASLSGENGPLKYQIDGHRLANYGDSYRISTSFRCRCE